jgi:protein-tyrosine phosphatase
VVFEEQLGRFYAAARLEERNLLEYYGFDPDLAPLVRRSVERVVGGSADGETLDFPNGRTLPNLCRFYEKELAKLLPLYRGTEYFSYVHGDLNGANILIDGHENVWLIDFFYTHYGHVLKDLIKFENDLLYILTPLADDEDLREALRLTDFLLDVADLGRPLPGPEVPALTRPALRRAYDTLRCLRSFYPRLVHEDRNSLQLFIGQLRYAVHTLTFTESSDRQKTWALYAASRCATLVTEHLWRHGPLRVDWIDRAYTRGGRLGMTLLPGRRDYGRSLTSDLEALRQAGVSHVVCLLTENEFSEYGVDNLLEAYREAGFIVQHLPILDQGVCSVEEMRGLLNWIRLNLIEGAGVLLQCVGGLGRSGTVAACYLETVGLSAEAAMAEVRRARSPRAIESAVQEEFVRSFPPLAG